MTNVDSNKDSLSQSYGISSSHVWMWELDHKEGWALKNWCFWIVVLERILESPFVSKELKPVHPKGNQPWIFIERTDAEAEVPKFWPPDVKSWLIWKRLWYWERLRQKEKRGGDGWMASPTQWTWVWINSRRWWRTGKPGMVHSMELERVWHDLMTEQP